jgi:hypothetical protein
VIILESKENKDSKDMKIVDMYKEEVMRIKDEMKQL